MAMYRPVGVFDLKSSAEEFFEEFTRKENHVTCFYPSEDLRFQVVSKSSETNKITVSIIGNIISKISNRVKAILIVFPGEDKIPSCLVYTFEFEKFRNSIEERKIVESLVTYLRLRDISYTKKIKHNSIVARYPAEECFTELVKAFVDDDDVELDCGDWQKRTFTMSFISGPCLMKNFEMIKVTIIVTPKNEGSCVKWIIQVQKIDDNTEEPDSFFLIACSIRESIQGKLRK